MAAYSTSRLFQTTKDFYIDEDQSQSCGQLGCKEGNVYTSSKREEKELDWGIQFFASVKEAQPGGKVKKGQVVYSVVVRAAMQRGRCDGSEVMFDDNAAVLVNKQGEPIGTRVFGPVLHELRKKKHVKILSLANHIE